MTNEIFATIDIGTNSVLLLIAKRRGNRIEPVEEQAEITRLGEGLAHSTTISQAASNRTLSVLAHYVERCKVHDVQEITVVGTAALRKAKNASAFLARAKEQLDLEIDVISGEQEAALTYEAAAHDFGNDIVVIDIGGGSTEFIWSQSKLISLPIGSVFLTERFLHSDPIEERQHQQLINFIDRILKKESSILRESKRTKLIATAGTATTMAAMKLKLESYDQRKVHGQSVTQEEIRIIIDQLKPLTIRERKKLKGLHPDRADAILAGATLLERSMAQLGYDEVTVSDRGLRWGLFYQRFAESDQGKKQATFTKK